MFYRQYYVSPLGRLSLVASEEALYGIWLEGQNHFQAGLEEEKLVDTSNPILEVTKKWLQAYFEGENPSPNILPLAERGTDFQQKVWSALRVRLVSSFLVIQLRLLEPLLGRIPG